MTDEQIVTGNIDEISGHKNKKGEDYVKMKVGVRTVNVSDVAITAFPFKSGDSVIATCRASTYQRNGESVTSLWCNPDGLELDHGQATLEQGASEAPQESIPESRIPPTRAEAQEEAFAGVLNMVATNAKAINSLTASVEGVNINIDLNALTFQRMGKGY